MWTDEQVQQFHEKGFLNGGPVLGADEVEALRGELKHVIENHDTLDQRPVLFANISHDSNVAVWQIVNIWMASAPYRRLMAHPKITEAIVQLTGASTLRIWHDQIVYKPSAAGGVNMWHQDAPLWPVIEATDSIAAWIALDDVDESNGCMSMVPGSHLWGNAMPSLSKLPRLDTLPAEYEGHAVKAEFCRVTKGEVHFHHALTWHSSHANTSECPRRAIAYHYMLPGTRYVASGQHVMKPYISVADGEIMQGEYFPIVYP